MGQGMSGSTHAHHFFAAVQSGDAPAVAAALQADPSVLHETSTHDRLSALHVAAAAGHLEVLSLLLDRSLLHPDLVNREKQTPLMIAAMHGKTACVQKLLQAGAKILMFDSLYGRTCLHYAAYYGHLDCLQAILSAAQSGAAADSWGFARLVSVSDGSDATPLHLAAWQRHPDCVHILLQNGALVSASTSRYGSTPLHMAARGGSVDCVQELLAWGADRLQKDSSGKTPYTLALKRNHDACATLLNPSSTEPLVWPTPLNFISELNPETKLLLEAALMDANREREKKTMKGTAHSSASLVHSDGDVDDDITEVSDTELCCICFNQICTVEIQDCGHQICAHCILALYCHNKPNPTTLCLPALVCPFCRSNIAGLVLAKPGTNPKSEEGDRDKSSKRRKARNPTNFTEGSSRSFRGLSSEMISFRIMSCLGPRRI